MPRAAIRERRRAIANINGTCYVDCAREGQGQEVSPSSLLHSGMGIGSEAGANSSRTRAAHRFGFSRTEERKNETFRVQMNALGCTQGRFWDSGRRFFPPPQVCRRSRSVNGFCLFVLWKRVHRLCEFPFCEQISLTVVCNSKLSVRLDHKETVNGGARSLHPTISYKIVL